MALFHCACENKKFHYRAFFIPILLPHLTELSKNFRAGCFNLAQMKASVALCINKVSDAAAKSELKTDLERFESVLGEIRTPGGLADSCACQVAWRFGRAPKCWQTDHTHTQKGRQE